MSEDICCADPGDCDCDCDVEIEADAPLHVLAHAVAENLSYPTAQRLGVQFDKPGAPGPGIASGPLEESRDDKTSAGSGLIEHAEGREGS